MGNRISPIMIQSCNLLFTIPCIEKSIPNNNIINKNNIYSTTAENAEK